MGLRQGDADHRQTTAFAAWYWAGGLALLAVLLAVSGDSGRVWLRYERDGIAAGEAWRLLSGHLVHLGWSHCLLNVAGLGLITYLLADRYSVGAWLVITLGTVLIIDIGFWFFEPQLVWYVGLSGLLHGYLAAGAVSGLKTGQFEYWLLAAFVAGKLLYEQLLGPLPGSTEATGGNVVVAAHLYGALGGALLGIGLSFRKAPSAAI